MEGMYFDGYDTPVFRPPSEARSFILRVTRGCAQPLHLLQYVPRRPVRTAR